MGSGVMALHNVGKEQELPTLCYASTGFCMPRATTDQVIELVRTASVFHPKDLNPQGIPTKYLNLKQGSFA
jgi:hypothetical protein